MIYLNWRPMKAFKHGLGLIFLAGSLTFASSGDDRVTHIGTVFKAVFHPRFETAFRDPSGLIWSNTIKNSNYFGWEYRSFSGPAEAEYYCNLLGAHLPTKTELERFAKYFGKGTSRNFSPYTADKKEVVLPDSLTSIWFQEESNQKMSQHEYCRSYIYSQFSGVSGEFFNLTYDYCDPLGGAEPYSYARCVAN